jgi:hypothetical protein
MEALAEGTRLLPFKLTETVQASEFGKNALRFQGLPSDSRLLRIFQEPESGDLSSVKVWRCFRTEEGETGGRILLAYEEGPLALGTRRMKKGMMMLANFSAHRNHSDLAIQPIFPPLLHEIVSGLRNSDPVPLDFGIGDSVKVRVLDLSPEDIASVEVTRPDRTPVHARTDPEAGVITLGPSASGRTGFYRLRLGEREVGLAGVNTDPVESDLRTLALSDLRGAPTRATKESPVYIAESGIRLRDLKEGHSLWPYAVALALLVILLEQSLVCRWRT